MTSPPDLLPRVMSLAVHELRTPVTVVGGYLRMLLREQAGPLTERQRKMLEEFRETETGDECPASRNFFKRLKAIFEG